MQILVYLKHGKKLENSLKMVLLTKKCGEMILVFISSFVRLLADLLRMSHLGAIADSWDLSKLTKHGFLGLYGFYTCFKNWGRL